MDINFLASNALSKMQKINKVNSFSSNPINFKGSANKDSIELSENAKIQKRIEELSKEIQDIAKKEEAIAQQLKDGEIKVKEFNNEVKPLRSLRREKSRERKLLFDTQKFIDSGIEKEKPNTAFLYDPRLSDKEKEEILSKHPEIKTLNQIAQEAGNPKVGSDNALYYKTYKMFDVDTFNSTRYIDTSNPENIQNYEALKSQLKGKIPLFQVGFNSESETDINILRAMARRGTLEPVRVTNRKTGGNLTIYLVDDGILDKMENFDKLFPKKSKKYYKSLLRDPKEPLLVPITYLSKLGYGTPQQLYANFKKGYFKGVEKDIEKDGKKIKYVAINIASVAAENNLELMKKQNKNYFTPNQLANALGVSLCEIEKAVINGELEATNEYIFSSPSYVSGIDLNNPKNEEYASRLAFVEQTKQELLQAKAESKERNKTLFGLKSKIAWALSPQTKETASNIAKKDGYIIKILEKMQRIKEAQELLNDNADENNEDEIPMIESLTKEEEAALNKYRKTIWEISGTEEYSKAYKKASEIVKIYQRQGIEAIEEPEIKEIIKNYME